MTNEQSSWETISGGAFPPTGGREPSGQVPPGSHITSGQGAFQRQEQTEANISQARQVLRALPAGRPTPWEWGEGRDPAAGLPPGEGHSPVSPGPHSLPRFASWSYQGARAASACALGTARRRARSATWADSSLLFPGPRLPVRHHRHLDENKTFSSIHQQIKPALTPNGSLMPAAVVGLWRAKTRKTQAQPSGTFRDSEALRDSPITSQVPKKTLAD